MSSFDYLKYIVHPEGLRKLQSFDFVIPSAILLLTFYFSTFGLLFTLLFLFVILPVIFAILQARIYCGNKINSSFYISWTVSSLLILLYVFEFVVVSFLEITIKENYLELTFVSISVGIVCFLRYKNKCDLNIDDKPNRLLYYNQWIGTNVHLEHAKLYLLSLVMINCALIFGSYLSVTTICHTFQFGVVLVPDDCSEIYFDANLSISFVSALYAGMLACVILYSSLKLLYTLTKRAHFYNLVSST